MPSQTVTSSQHPVIRRMFNRGKRKASLPGISHHKRSSSLTMPGYLFVFVTLFLALGAINGQNNLLFWLFGFSIASLIVSGIITGNALMSIRLTAHPLDHTELGVPLKPKYTLHNTSRLLPNFALEIIELDAPGYSKKTPKFSVPGIALHIRPKAHCTMQTNIVPVSRGFLELNTIRVRTSFPFGLFSKSIDFDAPRATIVYPQRLDIDFESIKQQTESDESTTRSLNRRGAGLEYYAIREYQPGDPLRTIAWKQSARTDTLRVTEFPKPTVQNLVICLGMPNDAVSEELFEQAISLAYSLLITAPTNTRIGLSIPSASIIISAVSGRAQIDRCAKMLALLNRVDIEKSNTSRLPRGSKLLTIGYSRSINQDQMLYAEDYLTEFGSIN